MGGVPGAEKDTREDESLWDRLEGVYAMGDCTPCRLESSMTEVTESAEPRRSPLVDPLSPSCSLEA